MPKLVTWMNNQRVGELTKLANGAHTFKYAPEWLASRYARPLSLSLPLQRGNITSDAYLTSSITCYPIARLYVTGSLNVIMPNPDNRLIYCQK